MQIERARRSSPTGGERIEHHVTRFDTLAGVAIKYGVEVADIKKMNGLVTDLQMFAHRKLQIPLPGRHPPSNGLSNGSSINGHCTPPGRRQSDLLDSIQSLGLRSPNRKVSPAMCKLQGYYGLAPKVQSTVEGTEMVVYSITKALDVEDKDWQQRTSPHSVSRLGSHRKTRSYANGFFPESMDLGEDAVADPADNPDSERYQSEKSVRRRQKVETDTPPRTREILIRDENGAASARRTIKSLAPRPKSGNRTDSDAARLAVIPFGESFVVNGQISVRKSSSTSNLQDSESSLWPTVKMMTKVDATARQLFDGVPKPLSSWKNKAALD